MLRCELILTEGIVLALAIVLLYDQGLLLRFFLGHESYLIFLEEHQDGPLTTTRG